MCVCVCAGGIPVWGPSLYWQHPCLLTIFKNLIPHQRVQYRNSLLYMGPGPSQQPAGTGSRTWSRFFIVHVCIQYMKQVNRPSMCCVTNSSCMIIYLSNGFKRLTWEVLLVWQPGYSSLPNLKGNRCWLSLHVCLCCVRWCRSVQSKAVCVLGRVSFVSLPSRLLTTPPFIS